MLNGESVGCARGGSGRAVQPDSEGSQHDRAVPTDRLRQELGAVPSHHGAFPLRSLERHGPQTQHAKLHRVLVLKTPGSKGHWDTWKSQNADWGTGIEKPLLTCHSCPRECGQDGEGS